MSAHRAASPGRGPGAHRDARPDAAPGTHADAAQGAHAGTAPAAPDAAPAAPDAHPEPGVDPRGQRFAAAVTTAVLAAVLLTENLWLLTAQAAIFAIGAFAGVRHSPYAIAYAKLIRPRLGPPPHTEAPQPPRFAQAVGLAFAAVAIAGFATGLTTVALAATGLALAAAFLNAAFGFCLGCEIYLLTRRAFPHRNDRTNRDNRNNRNNNRASTPTEVSA
jgi:Domain of unknown function (DUF4395)